MYGYPYVWQSYLKIDADLSMYGIYLNKMCYVRLPLSMLYGPIYVSLCVFVYELKN